MPQNGVLQLVGHHGGLSEHELWGLRADLEDAFVDEAPAIQVVLDPSEINADLVVMLAGVTISTDPDAPVDRAALGAKNAEIFRTYADALVGSSRSPVVVMQSNPVELGVEIFSRALGRHRVLGAAAWSDSLRFRQELAIEFGVQRPAVSAMVLGQHGDYLVPVWSSVRVRGMSEADVQAAVSGMRGGRSLVDLPDQIRAHKLRMVELVRAGDVFAAYQFVDSMPPDLRAAVKPFYTHFTAGRTTEVATAHAVADFVAAFSRGSSAVMPAQVRVEGEFAGCEGTVGVPIILGPSGWTGTVDIPLSEEEVDAIQRAADFVAEANARLLELDERP
jgi:malate dehydrogenase